ncbi:MULTISPECIES: hypothetical protein [Pseudomonas]|uniref:hypothetical protein n=1 Tax=Pseudomonas TaxID=286 RepID=UPI000FC41030|nr:MULTISPECIES: hypothetical protein [Pseudomonas]RUE17080.1 hypothetical protein IPC1222_25550 [Pseudomonas aeruginosa]CAH0134130.1 hypothetical protein SRABI111_00293 [Pseudomonas carnis]CAH0137099.1 hypothetical protein SRABI110_00437 [Pseudomonas carnis]CAH0160049.1 hypothetical protein SRABI64_00755 [Pseudomonas carnis]CAH0200080.1 hypothetical protein SRABI08_01871 [Pseudomonas carnis]
MEYIFVVFILLFLHNYNSTPEKIARITKKINKGNPNIFINIPAITIFLDKGYSEGLIIKYYPRLSKIIDSYNLKHNDDVYRYRADLLSEFYNLHNSEKEKLVRLQEEELNEAKINKALKILAIPALIALGFFVKSGLDRMEQSHIKFQNEKNAKAYGMAVQKAFEQAALEGDTANTVAELSDNIGKVYLSPDLNYHGKNFYISDIQGFESYALLDSPEICDDYSYEYDELVNRVKKYKFDDGCYDGKYFFMVKPVISEEEIKEKADHDLQEEVKRLRSEIEILKANNR